MKNDLTGQKFGKLTVLNKNVEKSGKNSYWDCICECGNIATVSRCNLRNGHTKSCGCLGKTENLIGQKFGRLSVIARAKSNDSHPMWKCLCDCGNETIVRSTSLTSGDTISCGCSRFLDLTGQKFGKLTAIRMAEPQISQGGIKKTVWECMCDCGNTAMVILNDLRTGNVKSCGCLRNHNSYRKSEYGYMIGVDVNEKEFYFDEEDFDIVSQYVWCIDNDYVITRIEQKRISMHRLLLNTPKNQEVDHINGNKADNRKCNLRICDHTQNMFNKPIYKSNKTGIKGVTFENGKYRARITAYKNVVDLGSFDNLEDAMFARFEAEKLHGDFSYYKREEVLNGRML